MSGVYDFSHIFNASVLAFSPGTTFIATAFHNRIVVRSTSTFQIVRTWVVTVKDIEASSSRQGQYSTTSPSSQNDPEEFEIDNLQWSGDGLYLLIHSSHAKMAWVYGLAEEIQSARIAGMSVEGLSKVEWAKSGREVLAWTDFNLKLSIYDLRTGEAKVIQGIKSNCGCYTYSPDSRYLATIEKHFGKEYTGIYDIHDSYSLIRHFGLTTTDAQGILWSPCGRYIAVWDTRLSYSLYIHSPLGPQISNFTPSSLTFLLRPEEMSGLGVRAITWAPTGRWLAVGGWDGKVRILENEGWTSICTISVGMRVSGSNTTVWREPEDWLRDTRGRGIVQFNRQPRPAPPFPILRPDLSKPNPRMGVCQISFEHSATLFLIRLESQPCVVHIYSFLPAPKSDQPVVDHLVSLVFTKEVKKAKWCPVGKKASVVTCGGGVYFWDKEAQWAEEDTTLSDIPADKHDDQSGIAEGVGIPTHAEFSAQDIQWSQDGKALAILDRSQFCLLYESETGASMKINEVAETSVAWDSMNEELSHVVEEVAACEERPIDHPLQVSASHRLAIAR
ncbi:hypothetical protein L204_100661 [Cryptococcus depauperatus]|nr:hypothetical protein L204_01409 [Cryptococcus depauperatus CBS 7855]